MIIVQLTGLSGSGKSTIAAAAAQKLIQDGFNVEVIDGDIYRKYLCNDLGFSKEDRNENIRRLGFVGSRLAKHGVIVIIAAINPYESVRQDLTKSYNNVYTIWINCKLDELIKRDTKNLYQKALLPDNHPDKIKNLTGINDPFEPPINPDLIIDTTNMTIDLSVEKMYSFIKKSLLKIKF